MTATADLAALVARISKSRIACVGDLMLDRFIHGEVERISPEAPIPVLRVTGETSMLGGAGNVVRNLAALGAGVRFAAVLGEDPAAAEVREKLRALPSVAAALLTAAGRPTTVKSRFLGGSQQILRADVESATPLPSKIEDGLAEAALGLLDGCQVLLLSDYGKGVFLGGLPGELIRAAQDRGLKVCIDPKGEDYRRYAGADVITPNRRELTVALGHRVSVAAEEEACRQLAARCAVKAVLLTQGRDGMLLVEADREAVRLATEAREVFDVSGAGDTVIATLAAALAAGARLVDAAVLANLAAGIVVGKTGTALVTPAELIHTLRLQDQRRGEAKIVATERAVERALEWRRQQFSVGFTNGCFDLLHPGHVSLLRQARAACGRLIVGLNSDASVARLKGAGRPLQSEAARAAVLASLADVDLVVVFEDDTPLRLIEALRPDVLVKGADYRLDQVVGADLVQRYGGRVLLADLEPGHSTSATLSRLAAQENRR
jgi:D-beta-D-heptose 7-phosphate kinase/D-beta-D-heptose 1-phosphate adenosyltransferase